MRDKHLFFSPRVYAGMLLLLLIVFGIYCFIKPLVLSIDSIYGFLAYKGSLFFHSFNVVQEVPASDIGKLVPVFESWWSPGQWLFPGILNYFFGIRLGLAGILVTLASLVSGFVGYYRVFDFYRFPRSVILLSLLLIFSSSTLYYCFVVYQGGEILEFGLFPWFLLYVIRIRKVSWWNLSATGIFFLLCFLGKTTLLLYCSFVLLAKIFQLNEGTSGNGIRLSLNSVRLFLPALLCPALVSVFFLSRGPRPVLIHHFRISADAVLVPLSSPLCSILSIQQWIKRGETILSRLTPVGGHAILFSHALYLLVFAILVWLARYFFMNKQIDLAYKRLLFILYAGLLAFFCFAYSFNANIDFSSRHFKLMGYLFIPGLITVLQEKAGSFRIHAAAIFFVGLSILDLFYLKEKWTRDRYIGINYFYRNGSPPGTKDKLDAASYQKLIEIDQAEPAGKDEPVVIFVESTADIAIDLRHPVILQTPADSLRAKCYRKNGAKLFVCISKSTLLKNQGILQWKFPDYRIFEPFAETGQYRYFLCSGEKGQGPINNP